MEKDLIAPCGMNCALCVNYQAMKNDISKHGFHKSYCPGCIPREKFCAYMRNKCVLIGEGKIRFCFECGNFPCERLKNLDKRYRTKYHMSMIDNLNFIKANGMDKFLENEEAKWRCDKCGDPICCHNGLCMKCGLDKLIKDKKYRWNG